MKKDSTHNFQIHCDLFINTSSLVTSYNKNCHRVRRLYEVIIYLYDILFFYGLFTAVQNAELLSQPGDSGPHADKGVGHWIQEVRNV